MMIKRTRRYLGSAAAGLGMLLLTSTAWADWGPAVRAEYGERICTKEYSLSLSAVGDGIANTNALQAKINQAVRELSSSLPGGNPACVGTATVGREDFFQIVIQLPPGTFLFDKTSNNVATDKDDVEVPCRHSRIACFAAMSGSANRRLVVRGADNATVVKYNSSHTMFHGDGANNLTVERMTLESNVPDEYTKSGIRYRYGLKTTQGIIRDRSSINAVTPWINVEIDAGFPEPLVLDDHFRGECDRDVGGLPDCRRNDYVKEYRLDGGIPTFLFAVGGAASPYHRVALQADTRQPTRMTPDPPVGAPPPMNPVYRMFPVDVSAFSIGQRVAFKMKHGSLLAYYFEGNQPSRNVTLDRITFIKEARGVFENVNSVHYTNNVVRPVMVGSIVSALATTAGGVQIKGGGAHHIRGNTFESMGDDAIALFNTEDVGAAEALATTQVESNSMGNSWNRSIFMQDDGLGASTALVTTYCDKSNGCHSVSSNIPSGSQHFHHVRLHGNSLTNTYIQYAANLDPDE